MWLLSASGQCWSGQVRSGLSNRRKLPKKKNNNNSSSIPVFIHRVYRHSLFILTSYRGSYIFVHYKCVCVCVCLFVQVVPWVVGAHYWTGAHERRYEQIITSIASLFCLVSSVSHTLTSMKECKPRTVSVCVCVCVCDCIFCVVVNKLSIYVCI